MRLRPEEQFTKILHILRADKRNLNLEVEIANKASQIRPGSTRQCGIWIGAGNNAYEEGLSDGWNPIRVYWEDPSQGKRESLRSFLAPEATIWQFMHNVSDATHVSPEGYSLGKHAFGLSLSEVLAKIGNSHLFRGVRFSRGATQLCAGAL